MIISRKSYDEVNARNVELARALKNIKDIILKAEIDKTPSVIVVDKIKEVICRQN